MLEHLGAHGHATHLVAPSGPSSYAGAPVHRVRSVSMPSYRDFPVGVATRAHLRRVVDEAMPDVVHLASPAWLGHQAGEAARSLGVPVVAVYQTDLVGFAERYPFPGAVPLMRRLTRRVHVPADRTLAPSSASLAQLHGLGVPRVHRWGRGVDAELFDPRRRTATLRAELQAGDDLLVGYVGRLGPEKELELLRGVHALPGVRLVLVGGGPEEARLRALLPRASFLGVRHGEDLARMVASLDVFVHTGSTETFCQSVQEALASGVPVVAPRAGGPLDLVVEGRNGTLFDPGSEAALAGVVRELASRPGLRERLGRAARPSVVHRSWEAVNAELVGHYREVVAARRCSVGAA